MGGGLTGTDRSIRLPPFSAVAGDRGLRIPTVVTVRGSPSRRQATAKGGDSCSTHISLIGRIAYDPRFFPSDHEAPAMWSAVLEVNGFPTPRRDGSTYIPTRQVE